MNRLTLLVLLTPLLAVPLAQAADEEDHSAHHPAVEKGDAASASEDKGMGKNRDKMKKMQELMSKIHSTDDPKERARLLNEHMQAMRESMKTMNAMMNKGDVMGGKKKKESVSGEKDDHQHEDDARTAKPSEGGEMMMGGMMKMHKDMEQRMERLEKMLEQVIEHEAVEREMETR
jgi:Mg2+ and Co2+ transporter CorA